MAGLFDTISVLENDPALIKQRLAQQRAAQSAEFVSGATSEYDRYGRSILEGLKGLTELGAFGKDAKEAVSLERDPAYKAVKSNAELSAAIQEIEGDPSSSTFAEKASELAKQYGRDDLALKYREAAGTRKRAEVALAAKAEAAKVEEGRKQFSALPTAAQEELVAVKPDFLVETLGVDPAEAAVISKNVAERNQFQKAKLQKQLSDVSAATTTKTTNADVNQIKSTLSMFGISEASFGFGDNAEEFDNFATPIAAEVQRRMDVAKDKGERLDRNKVTDEVFKELETSGAIVLRDRWFGEGKVIDNIDTAKFKNVFTGGATGPVIDLTQ